MAKKSPYQPLQFWIFLLLAYISACGMIENPPVEEKEKAEEVDKDDNDGKVTDGSDDDDTDPPGGDDEVTTDGEDNTVEVDGDDETLPRVPCEAPSGVSLAPTTIQEVTDLINALPMPVSVPCLLDVLERPLKLNAVSSTLSVQPAGGPDNPRLFLYLGTSLIVSFVPAGVGSEVVEFSYYMGNNKTLKGELAFPVTAPLADDAAYSKVLKPGGGGTTCSGCHFQEEPAPTGYPANAYISLGLKPFAYQDVPLTTISQLAAACEGETSLRCEVYQALVTDEDLEPATFNENFPNLF